jgi:hypothetical protein
MRNAYCLILIWISYPVAVRGADGDRTLVRLEIKRGAPVFSGQTVNFGQSRDEAVIAQPGTTRTGKAPGASVIAQPLAGQAHAYSLTIQGRTGDPVKAPSRLITLPTFNFRDSPERSRI